MLEFFVPCILSVVCDPLKDALRNFVQSAGESLLTFSRERAVGGLWDAVARWRSAVEPVRGGLPASAIIGREGELSEIRSHLRDDSVGIVGIYGMGGIGKTTILRLVNDDFFKSWYRKFDLVIFAAMSGRGATSVLKLQSDVGARVGLSFSSDPPSNSSPDLVEKQAQLLFKTLLKKRFLLLLDDVQEKLNLASIGIPTPDDRNRCKIVFTTLSLRVCNEMGARVKKIELKLLDEGQSWALFRREAGTGEAADNPAIAALAERVAGRCGGLPLLLVHMGRVMADTSLHSEWERASNRMSEFERLKDSIFDHLRTSFDSLKDDSLRSCLLYCSLFPEDHEIDKRRLVDCWIGEGFLDAGNYESVDSARSGGHMLIRELQSSSLLESSGLDEEETVKLHVSVRLMASWLTSARSGGTNTFVSLAGGGLATLPGTGAWREATRVSLTEHKIRGFPDVTPDCPNLATLLMNGSRSVQDGDQKLRHKAKKRNEESIISFPDASCEGKSVRKLWTVQVGEEASRIHICNASSLRLMAEEEHARCRSTGLPDNFFQFMPALRVLDISHTSVDRLPSSIGSLGELRHLNASFTNIKSLPAELGKLAKLRHLDLRCTQELTHIPREAIVSLRALQVLNMYDSAYNWFWVGRDRGRQVGLDGLEALHCLDEVGLDLGNIVPFGGLMKSPKLKESTRFLKLSEVKSLWTAHLRESFEKLGQLRELCLDACPEVEKLHIGNRQLPRLEVLRLLDLPKLASITLDDKDNPGPLHNGAFPRLKEMHLNNLPMLMCIASGGGPHSRLSSLVAVEVRRCPTLRRLPLRPDAASRKLKRICGEQEWWDGLEWEDSPDGTDLQSALLPFFRPAECSVASSS